jgi:hypothetical protein
LGLVLVLAIVLVFLFFFSEIAVISVSHSARLEDVIIRPNFVKKCRGTLRFLKEGERPAVLVYQSTVGKLRTSVFFFLFVFFLLRLICCFSFCLFDLHFIVPFAFVFRYFLTRLDFTATRIQYAILIRNRGDLVTKIQLVLNMPMLVGKKNANV